MGGTALVSKKLNSIIIPHIEFRDATIREAIDVLREQAAENDTGPEGQRGVNIVLRLVPIGQVAPPSIPVQPAAPPTGTGAPAGGAPAGGAPPEFFGGPLDVGYYIGSNVGGGGYGGGQTGGSQSGSAQAPPVSTNVIEKEALSYQTASGVGYGAGAASQANLVQGTATTRQT